MSEISVEVQYRSIFEPTRYESETISVAFGLSILTDMGLISSMYRIGQYRK